MIQEWRANEVDQTELQQLLLSHFGSAATNDRQVIYKHGGEEALRLSYTRAGNLERIEALHGLTADDRAQIPANLAETFLADHGIYHHRAVIFCHNPITGSFRYRDLFQIYPVPADAPRPPHVLGGHPGLIAIAIPGCPNISIRWSRGAALARKLELILGMLLPPVESIQGSLGRFEWVYGDPVPGVGNTSEYRQAGYTYPGPSQPETGFADIASCGPMPAMAWQEYYQRDPAIYHEPLTLPENLAASLDRIFALPQSAQAAFFRSCYWLHTSRQTFHVSRSASYIALVSAIESLLPQTRNSPCDNCGKPTGDGPTALFKQFLETYLPNAIPASVRSEFYSIRSELTHGGAIMFSDMLHWGMNHRTINESGNQRHLTIAARAAIYNWLWQPR